MKFDTDSILLLVAGMILGGYVYVKTESIILSRYFPNAEGEERIQALRKIGFRLTFIGVFFFVLTFFLLKSAVLSGVFLGFAIFGIKP
ncbi:MAG: hypothetical protein C0602_13185 [Denitrovibrio sp.]|nr:MAG: hypothetical protein C0602_13185 [Denitrovibrio sp.]